MALDQASLDVPLDGVLDHLKDKGNIRNYPPCNRLANKFYYLHMHFADSQYGSYGVLTLCILPRFAVFDLFILNQCQSWKVSK